MINVEECRSQRLSNTGNSTGTQLTYPLLITVLPVQHLYIESEVVILFDDAMRLIFLKGAGLRDN